MISRRLRILSWLEIIRRIYEARGLRTDQILLLPSQTTSTADDLEVLGKYLVDHPGQHACVVTNAYHTRRTRWTLWNRLHKQAARIAVVSAPNPEFDFDDWWQSRDGIQCVASEYLKLGWYFLRYGYGVVILGSCALLLVVVYRVGVGKI